MIDTVQKTLGSILKRLSSEPVVAESMGARVYEAPVEDTQAIEAVISAAEILAEVVEDEIAEEICEDNATLRDPFSSRIRRVAAFLSNIGRVVRVFIAARYHEVIVALDAAGTIGEKVKVFTSVSVSIARDLAILGALGGTSFVGFSAVKNPEQVPAKIESAINFAQSLLGG